MDLFLHTLSNGIRLVHYRTSGEVAYCGLMINAGSCDEEISLGEHGAAHFIEHMLFKGTKRRKAYHILSYLDSIGGELNAYTTKEETAIYSSLLKNDIERAFNIISDITFNSTFPTKEMEKEKDVIVEEINSYLDSPDELIFDDFEELIFKDEPIGRNILGTPQSVKEMDVSTLTNFINKNYHTDEMVLCTIGNIPSEKVLYLFKKYFGDIATHTGPKRAKMSHPYVPTTLTKKFNTFQTHCIIGNMAYSLEDDRRIGLVLLNNILGGQGLNSRLNLSLREKNGLSYSAESSYTPYHDTGVFTLYFDTDHDNLNRSIDISKSELEKLRSRPLGSNQLRKAKNQLKGYLARSYENYENLMLSLCKNFLVFGKIDPTEELYKKIDGITSEDLQDIANEIFDPNRLSVLIYE